MFRLNWRLDYFSESAYFEYGFSRVLPNLPVSIPYQVGFQRLNHYSTELNFFVSPTSYLDFNVGGYWNSVLEFTYPMDMMYLGALYTNAISKISKDETIDKYAVYSEVTLKLHEKFSLVGGARIEKPLDFTLLDNYSFMNPAINPTFELNKHKFTYENPDVVFRGAAIFNINRSNTLKFFFGQAINQPPIAFCIDNFRTKKEIPKSEKIQAYEINYMLILASKAYMNISLFRNELEQLQTRKGYTLNNNTFVFTDNSGKIETHGGEASIVFKPFKNFTSEVSASYQQSKDLSPERDTIDVAYSPQLLGYIKMVYGVGETRVFKNCFISLTGVYVSEMESYWNASNPNFVPSRIGPKTDAYFKLNANIKFTGLLKTGAYLSFHVSNLTNTTYSHPITMDITWANKNLPCPERQYYLTLGYTF